MSARLNRTLFGGDGSPSMPASRPVRGHSVAPKPMPPRVWKASRKWRSGTDEYQSIAEQGGGMTTLRVYRSRNGSPWEQVGGVSLFGSELSGSVASLKELLGQIG